MILAILKEKSRRPPKITKAPGDTIELVQDKLNVVIKLVLVLEIVLQIFDNQNI